MLYCVFCQQNAGKAEKKSETIEKKWAFGGKVVGDDGEEVERR